MSSIIQDEVVSKVAVIARPGVTLYNGADQIPITISNRATGETIVFGNRLGERTFEGVHLVLTNDRKNGVWWILAVDTVSGATWQNGYLKEDYDDALRLFIGGSEADIRSVLMSDVKPSN